jgi:nucleotide-binding universal stress UspA family protein
MIPPRTILAAVDFSDGSRAALRFASRLAVQYGGALHVVHAEDPLLCAAARHQGRNLSEETLEELRRFTGGTWPTATCNPHLHVVAGTPADVILDVSNQESVDVIVMGSRGMSGAERLLFGSTTEYVLRRADVSVLVVPPQWTPARIDLPDLTGTGPLIVGIDFSSSSVLAASAAAWLAASLHAWIDVVHVVPASRVLERWQAHATASVHERMDAARRDLSAIVQRLAGTVPLDTRVEVGDVPERLTAIAKAHPALSPLIVLGRQAGGSRGSAPGAIAYRVLTQASVPVLVYLGRS